jgi:Na+/H+-dicarboxylate symporter
MDTAATSTRSKDRWVTFGSLVAMVAGAALGEWIHRNGGSADGFALVGEMLLVRPLLLLVVPLILLSVIGGAASLGATGRLGLLGGATLAFFVSTMAIAAALGACLVSWFAPGAGIDPAAAAALKAAPAALPAAATSGEVGSLQDAWRSILFQLVPKNVFGEMVAARPLGLITFSILIGLGLSAIGDAGRTALDVIEGLNQALMRAIGWVLWVLPIGVLALVTSSVARAGLDALSGSLGAYMLVVIGGLLLHALVVLPLIMVLLGGGNPYAFMWRVRRALVTAFSTSSSSATLPVTMEACESAGCSRRATRFVCPLGSTLNMDGTALYEAVAVVFLCQLFGIALGGAELAVVVVTATLAAVGAAGIPSAGLVTMVLVVQAVNASLGNDPARSLPIEAIGIIIGVDRILDMVRTMVNVQGDMIGARLLTRLAPD